MTLTELQHRFSRDTWPEFLSIEQSKVSCRLVLKMNADIHWFEGHFPEQPVLAGVVQMHWAADLAKALFTLGDEFQGVDNLKFQTVILPGQIVSLQLQFLSESQAVKFLYQCDDNVCSEGKLIFSKLPAHE